MVHLMQKNHMIYHLPNRSSGRNSDYSHENARKCIWKTFLRIKLLTPLIFSSYREKYWVMKRWPSFWKEMCTVSAPIDDKAFFLKIWPYFTDFRRKFKPNQSVMKQVLWISMFRNTEALSGWMPDTHCQISGYAKAPIAPTLTTAL